MLLAQLLHAFHLISSDHLKQLRMTQARSTWMPYEVDNMLRSAIKQSEQGLLFIDLDDVANRQIDVQWLRCKLSSLTAEMPGNFAFVIAIDNRGADSSVIDMPLSTSVVHFSDYSADELMAILISRLHKYGFVLAVNAETEVRSQVQYLCSHRSYLPANARTIKHIFTALTAAAELRCASMLMQSAAQPEHIATDSQETLMTITLDDVRSIKWHPVTAQRIGFDV